MRLSFFLAIAINLSCFSQTKDLRKRYQDQQSEEAISEKKPSLGSRGLNRLFIDGVIGAGLLTVHHKDYIGKQFAITSDFRIGNNFYLGHGESPMIIRLTYFRIGIFAGEFGGFPYFMPPQLGLSKHFKITKTISMEPGIHLGYIFFSGDVFDGDVEKFGFYVMPEIKFNFSRFSLGFEYSTRKLLYDGKPSSTWFERYNYIGISLGRRIGKDL